MQAISVIFSNSPYNDGMATGRPSKIQRTQLGERIHFFREQRGLSQQALAEVIGVHQRKIAYWERHAQALPPEQLIAISNALHVGVGELLGQKEPARRGGPIGKAQRVFEQVSQLPRSRQQHIVRVVEDLLKANVS
jgi:transcriptional regulator with XRE-family HTH domain